MNEKEILDTCAAIAKKSEMFAVNIYRYTEKNKRAICFSLKAQGKLIQGETHNKLFHFYRPEDAPILEAAYRKHEKEMKKVYAKNVIWHQQQAEKQPVLREYHLKEAEKNMELSK